MENTGLTLELSPWLIPLCLLAGAFYAWLLYKNQGPWGKNTHRLLTGLRFVAVSLLCFLLLGPLVRRIQREVEPPQWVLAVDNSLSVAEVTESGRLQRLTRQVQDLRKELEEDGSRVEISTFNGEKNDSLRFDAESSDLYGLLKNVQNDYEGRNLAGVVLLTDGIYNQGISPLYAPYPFPVYTIGLGDTIPRSDISLRNLYFNKVAYQGNKFPLVAEVHHQGIGDQKVKVAVIRGGKELATKNINLNGEEGLQRVEFILEADEEGMQHYMVQISPRPEEFTSRNNTRDAYIEVIEGKQRILMVAIAPHPDLKAIRASLERSQNYEVALHIPGLEEANLQEVYDLIIYHQVPDRRGTTSALFRQLKQRDLPAWYILGPQSDLRAIGNDNNVLSFRILQNETDEVVPAFNDTFTRFNYNPALRQRLESFPPVSVPFGRFDLNATSEVVLFQQVGSLVTSKPLLVVQPRGTAKSAVLLGSGIWQWRLSDFANNDSQQAFDELVSKLVQYLAAREDKRRFRVYPLKNEYYDSEPVVFETEVYNEIFEPVYDQEVSLSLTNEAEEIKNYDYTTSKGSTRYRIGGLKPGIYKYKASTVLNGETLDASGEFSISNLQVENIRLTADHELLRQLSRQTGGSFFLPDQWEQLEEQLKEIEAPGIIYANEEKRPILDNPFWMILLLLLLTGEWAIRRYSGSY